MPETDIDLDADKDTEVIRLPEELAVLPVEDTVIPPGIMVPLVVQEEDLIQGVDEVAVGHKLFVLVAERPDAEQGATLGERFYSVGSAVEILQMLKYPDNTIRLLVRGVARVRIDEYTQIKPYLKAKVHQLADIVKESSELKALIRNSVILFEKVCIGFIRQHSWPVFFHDSKHAC